MSALGLQAVSESGWCDPGEDPWDWISQLGLNSLSDGTDGLLEMPKLTNEDLAAEHQPADEAIIAATSQAIKDFTGWSEPPLALVCDDLALSLAKKNLLRQESNSASPSIPETDLRVDIFRNGAEHSVKLTHMPTVEIAIYGGSKHRNLFALKKEAMDDLSSREAVIRYYENQKEKPLRPAPTDTGWLETE